MTSKKSASKEKSIIKAWNFPHEGKTIFAETRELALELLHKNHTK